MILLRRAVGCDLYEHEYHSPAPVSDSYRSYEKIRVLRTILETVQEDITDPLEDFLSRC